MTPAYPRFPLFLTKGRRNETANHSIADHDRRVESCVGGVLLVGEMIAAREYMIARCDTVEEQRSDCVRAIIEERMPGDCEAQVGAFMRGEAEDLPACALRRSRRRSCGGEPVLHLRHLDLFSGCGNFIRAAQLAGTGPCRMRNRGRGGAVL